MSTRACLLVWVSLIAPLLAAGSGLKSEAASPVKSDSSDQLVHDGSALWRGINDLVVDEPYIYCAMEPGVAIYKMGDDNHPALVGQCPTQFPARSIAKFGKRLFVGQDRHDVVSVDISDPDHPFVCAVSIPACNARAFYATDNLLWICCGSEMKVMEVSNKGDLTEISNFTFPQDSLSHPIPVCIAVRDHVAYVGADDLWIIDFNDFSTPRLLSKFRVKQKFDLCPIVDVVLRDSLAIVGAQSSVRPPTLGSPLVALNIRDKVNPAQLASVTIADNIYDIESAGDTIFVAADANGLKVLTVEPDGALNPVACIPTATFVTKLALLRNSLIEVERPDWYRMTVYHDSLGCSVSDLRPASTEPSLITVYDRSNLVNPKVLGRVPYPGQPASPPQR